MVAVKICGVTRVQDAELCVAAGVDAIGLNFYAGSSRCVDLALARRIVEAIAGRALTVGVFVDSSYERVVEVKAETGIVCAQLHGDESPALLERLMPHAYKAIRVRDEASIEQARRFGGKHILLDAFVPGQAGGTGRTFNWALAKRLASERLVTLAGGLDPSNVAAALASVRPFCVDVASGVELEHAAGHKDPGKLRAFVAAAKAC